MENRGPRTRRGRLRSILPSIKHPSLSSHPSGCSFIPPYAPTAIFTRILLLAALAGFGALLRGRRGRSPSGPASRPAWSALSVGRGDPVEAGVGDERLGNPDGAVLLLEILEDRDEGSAHRQAGAVEGVDELRLRLGSGTVPDVGAAGLEILEVGAGGDLPEGLLAREPDLQIVRLGRGKAHVASGQADHPVVQSQTLQDRLGVACERFQLVVGALRPSELHDLHLVELVL